MRLLHLMPFFRLNNNKNMLTYERLREVLEYDPDQGVFKWLVNRSRTAKVGWVAGCKRSDEYIFIMINGKSYAAHRLAWLYMTGEWPVDQIDHYDHIKYNNRFYNLREATQQENNKNWSKRIDNTSGITGINWYKQTNKWVAQIQHNGKKKHLGYFDNIEEATKVRKDAEIKYNYHPNHGK